MERRAGLRQACSAGGYLGRAVRSSWSFVVIGLALLILGIDGGVDAGGTEGRLQNIRQLTFGGENTKAHFSIDGNRLIFQGMRSPEACDQIFAVDVSGGEVRRLSTGVGRTTCANYIPGERRFVFASTHLDDFACPSRPPLNLGYVWPLYAGYELFLAEADGSDFRRLTEAAGYDAEVSVSPDGSALLFTSTRDGDPDLYSMKLDGTGLKRLTFDIGYDGSAAYSRDGNLIVYCGYHPQDPEELALYGELLEQGFVKPDVLEIFVMNRDGSNREQLTFGGAASFGPSFHPDGKHVVFSSNMADQRRRNFDLYIVNVDGTGLDRITVTLSFESWPVFSPDGKELAFISNRNAGEPEETNLFIADWVP